MGAKINESANSLIWCREAGESGESPEAKKPFEQFSRFHIGAIINTYFDSKYRK